MTTLVIGKSGQLANELKLLLPSSTTFFGSQDIDLFDQEALEATLVTFNPRAIINAAAYTAVDGAESDKENAFQLNALAVENLATFCKSNNCFLVHVSTDYVFNGTKGVPYLPDDELEPGSVYGESKAAGESFLQSILGEQSTLIRTSWVYSQYGNNFVKTMLRLMSEKPKLNVIDDQIGSPTWAKGLAQVCIEASRKREIGVFHWTDEGVASWYDFACAIQTLAIEKGMLSNKIPINPIPTEQYPTPAERPHYSVLDKVKTRKSFSTRNKHWYQNLSEMMDELHTTT